MNTEVILLKKESPYIKNPWGVIRWSLIRYKCLVPAFSLVQVTLHFYFFKIHL